MVATGLQIPGDGGYIPPIFDLHPPNNFDFSKKRSSKKFWMKLVEKHGFFYSQTRSLRIIPPPPPISENSPKYADHPPMLDTDLQP